MVQMPSGVQIRLTDMQNKDVTAPHCLHVQMDGAFFNELADQAMQAATCGAEEECLGAVYLAMQLKSKMQKARGSEVHAKQLKGSSFGFAERMDRNSVRLILSYLPSQ